MGYLWTRNIQIIDIKFLQKQFFSNYSLFNSRVIKFFIILKYSEKSFDGIDLWLKELRSNSSPDTKIFLIGNKCDLNEERVISIEKGEQLHNDYNLDLFLETSAKSGINTELLFVKAAKLLYNDYVKYKIGNPLIGRGKSTKKLKNDDKNEKKKKKKCC